MSTEHPELPALEGGDDAAPTAFDFAYGLIQRVWSTDAIPLTMEMAEEIEAGMAALARCYASGSDATPEMWNRLIAAGELVVNGVNGTTPPHDSLRANLMNLIRFDLARRAFDGDVLVAVDALKRDPVYRAHSATCSAVGDVVRAVSCYEQNLTLGYEHYQRIKADIYELVGRYRAEWAKQPA